MKLKLLFFLFATLFSATAFSQDSKDKTVYLDSLWKEIPKGNHTYYRIIKDYYANGTASYKILDYYKSGVLQMEGISSDKDVVKKNGPFTFYYENGTKSSVLNYDNQQPLGTYTQWYENGQKKAEGEYSKSNINERTNFTIHQFWDTNNVQKVIDGNGYYTNIDLKSKTQDAGKIKNGLKDSVWVGSNGTIKFSYTEKYDNGKLISGVSTDSQGVKRNYTELEIHPAPRKGLQHFYSYIGKKLRLPTDSISGKLILSFVINKDGSIDEVTTVKSLRDDVDKEAIKVVRSYRDWEPGKLRGIDVRVFYTIPISIVSPN